MVRIENRVLIRGSVDGIDNSRSHDFTIKFMVLVTLKNGYHVGLRIGELADLVGATKG